MKTKTFVRDFVYTTAKTNRESCKFVKFDGRQYLKFGIEQTITLVGNLFKVDENNEKSQYVLQIGMSKQHPKDTQCNKQMAIEYAQTNAFMNPIMVYYIQEGNNAGRIFNLFAEIITESMYKEFIKTFEEIKNNS